MRDTRRFWGNRRMSGLSARCTWGKRDEDEARTEIDSPSPVPPYFCEREERSKKLASCTSEAGKQGRRALVVELHEEKGTRKVSLDAGALTPAVARTHQLAVKKRRKSIVSGVDAAVQDSTRAHSKGIEDEIKLILLDSDSGIGDAAARRNARSIEVGSASSWKNTKGRLDTHNSISLNPSSIPTRRHVSATWPLVVNLTAFPTRLVMT
jgi:hypothetical protein